MTFTELSVCNAILLSYTDSKDIEESLVRVFLIQIKSPGIVESSQYLGFDENSGNICEERYYRESHSFVIVPVC